MGATALSLQGEAYLEGFNPSNHLLKVGKLRKVDLEGFGLCL